MDGATIIIAYHDLTVSERLCACLRNAGHKVKVTGVDEPVENYLAKEKADLFLADDNLPAIAGQGLINYLQDDSGYPPIIILTQNGTVERAVEAVQRGAKDYLIESTDETLILKKINQILQGAFCAKSSSANNDRERPIITQSPMMRNLLDMAQKVAASSATVLIQGESGTGKELIARYIHRHCGRNKDLFVAMNCAALPENLAESELFGYEKGAFTGAVTRKIGKFEQANGGTLLLDEISEMPLVLQAKLLRTLQEKQIDPVGSRRTISVDCRIIATTNRDLAKMVKEGRFREDLYYRLRVIPLVVPSLRSRPEDIPILIEHFIHKFKPLSTNQEPCFSAQALAKMKAWHWPGNVRELENTIERAILISNGREIETKALLLDSELEQNSLSEAAALVGLTVKELEQKLIEQTLSHVNQNRTTAAEMLGISIRTLRNKLREYRSDEE